MSFTNACAALGQRSSLIFSTPASTAAKPEGLTQYLLGSPGPGVQAPFTNSHEVATQKNLLSQHCTRLLLVSPLRGFDHKLVKNRGLSTPADIVSALRASWLG